MNNIQEDLNALQRHREFMMSLDEIANDKTKEPEAPTKKEFFQAQQDVMLSLSKFVQPEEAALYAYLETNRLTVEKKIYKEVIALNRETKTCNFEILLVKKQDGTYDRDGNILSLRYQWMVHIFMSYWFAYCQGLEQGINPMDAKQERQTLVKIQDIYQVIVKRPLYMNEDFDERIAYALSFTNLNVGEHMDFMNIEKTGKILFDEF